MLQPLALIPYCNVPDALTGEEDATITKHTGKYPHEYKQAYNAEI